MDYNMAMHSLLAVLVVLCLAACGKDSDKSLHDVKSFVESNQLKSHINVQMQKVRGFFIKGNEVAGPCDNCPPSELNAIDDTGNITRVDITEGPSAESMASPKAILDSPAFVFFRYDNVRYNGRGCQMVPVRKSDGAMFCLEFHIEDCAWCYYQTVQSDPSGQHLYAWGQQEFVKLSFRGIDDSTITRLAGRDTGGGELNSFQVNRQGDALAVFPKYDGSTSDIRLYKSSGGFVQVAASKSGLPCLFTGSGTDGSDFFYIDGDQRGYMESHQRIVRVDMAGGAVTTVTYAEDTTGGLHMRSCNGGSRAQTKDRTFFKFMPGQPDNIGFVEVANPAAKPYRHRVTGLQQLGEIYGCEDAIYLQGTDSAGKEKILRYTPATGTYDEVMTVGEFVVSKVTVDAACTLVFSGRRAVDNARIVGKVNPGSKTVTIVAESTDKDIQAVQMIR